MQESGVRASGKTRYRHDDAESGGRACLSGRQSGHEAERCDGSSDRDHGCQQRTVLSDRDDRTGEVQGSDREGNDRAAEDIS